MKKLFALLALLPSLCFGQRTVLYNESDFTLYAPSSFWTANSTSISNALSLSVFLTQPEGDALYQPKDATLTALAGASTGSDTLVYFSAADTAAVTTFTSWGRGLVDDADQTAARVTLGLVPGTDVQAYDADLAAVAGLASNGLVARTSSGNFSTRTITGDSEITVSNGDGVSGNPTLAIASSITRDSELSNYQPLDTDLTRLAGIGSGTEGDILYRDSVGWTNLARGANGYVLTATASTIGWSPASGGGDVTQSGNNTFTGTNAFNGTIEFGGGFSTTNLYAPNRKRVVLHENEYSLGQSISTGDIGLPSIVVAAISSGTISASQTSATNHQGLARISSASGANSGVYGLSAVGTLFSQIGLTWESISRPLNTNAGVRVYIGFQDSTSAGAATDGIHLFRSNNIIIPQVYYNGSLTQGSEYTISSNQFLHTKIAVTAAGSARFVVTDSDTGTSILDETITTTLPDTPSRLFGLGWKGFYTNAAAAAIEDFDWTTAYYDRAISR